jgi:hypothetical protein
VSSKAGSRSKKKKAEIDENGNEIIRSKSSSLRSEYGSEIV